MLEHHATISLPRKEAKTLATRGFESRPDQGSSLNPALSGRVTSNELLDLLMSCFPIPGKLPPVSWGLLQIINVIM